MSSHRQRVGAHQVCVEGDVLKMEWIGDLTIAETQDVISIVEKVLTEHARVFVIVDARKAGGIHAEARKVAAQWPNYQRVAGLAYIGASLTVRVLARITLSARKLLGGAPPGPTHFVDTEEQAHACIEALRREVMSQASADGM